MRIGQHTDEMIGHLKQAYDILPNGLFKQHQLTTGADSLF